jgi:hypothetical protein
MFMVVALCLQGQEQTVDSSFTGGLPNGLFWLHRTPDEKLMLILGMKYGAGLVFLGPMAGTLPACPTRLDTQKWDPKTATNEEIVKAVDAFYKPAANLPLPVPIAVVYTLMKIDKAPVTALDNYRQAAIRAFVILK